jgi:hypothetical protein
MMAGTINLVNSINIPAEIKLIGETKVIGNVTASMFTGSGAGLFDIPLSALSREVFRIASGSVTASVSPNRGLVVDSFQSGSNFSGSVQIGIYCILGVGAVVFDKVKITSYVKIGGATVIKNDITQPGVYATIKITKKLSYRYRLLFNIILT